MTIDSYENPDAQELLRAVEERRVRRSDRGELIANVVGAACFLIAATLLAAIAPWHRPLSVLDAALLVGVWIALERARFPVAGGWTYPTMLAFVPALFVLPTPVVPLIAMVAILLGAIPDLLAGRTPLTRVPALILGGWFTIGPALVIVVAGGDRFAWSHWPIYTGALLAQLVFDMSATIGWSWSAEGISPRVQLPLLTWVYLVDVTLAPLGLAIAALAVNRPGLVLLALSPMAMLTLFARERQQRLDHTLALSTAYRGTALLLGDVVEADDNYTGLHSRDVVDLSLAVADELGLDAARRRNVEFAALLHDVGKIRIPKEIINKAGVLDPAEWEIIRQHTIEGEKMLKQVGGTLASVGRIVRHSHEHYNGRGYPDGIAGEAIPIESRIVSACDAYSAMTTNRAYRPAMSVIEALAELRRCAGTQFDPKVVQAIVRLTRAQLPSVGAGHATGERRLPVTLNAMSRLRRRDRRLLGLRAALAYGRRR